jgi:O-antigen ligase
VTRTAPRLRPVLGADLRPARPPGLWPELLLVAYWLSFCLYETVFADVTIEGFFYPFYLAFVAVAVGTLARRGLRLWLPATLAYVAFLAVVAAAFVGFPDPVGFGPVQRVVAYLFGLLAALQVRSRAGLRLLAGGAIVTALAVSAWVIVSAALGGFGYRGDVATDPNVAAFFIGPGAVLAAAGLQHAGRDRAARAWRVPAAVALGATLYASALLASRGTAIALVLALVALAWVGVARTPRAPAFLLTLLLLATAAFLMPGGAGLAERFAGERIETGGSRLPIWSVTLQAYREGDPMQLLLGHGFDASKREVQNAFGTVTSTHNAYLQVLYEFGLFGLAAFLALHLAPLARAGRMTAPWAVATVGTVVFLLGTSASVNAADGFLYWAALGFVLAACAWAPVRPVDGRDEEGRGRRAR